VATLAARRILIFLRHRIKQVSYRIALGGPLWDCSSLLRLVASGPWNSDDGGIDKLGIISSPGGIWFVKHDD
jgi:hypothetical protein